MADRVAAERPGASADAEAIARFVNDQAPYYFVPRYLEFVTELPRNAMGKVTKPAVRALF